MIDAWDSAIYKLDRLYVDRARSKDPKEKKRLTRKIKRVNKLLDKLENENNITRLRSETREGSARI